MLGAEINSTEEALAAFESLNRKIDDDPKWRELNILQKIFTPTWEEDL